MAKILLPDIASQFASQEALNERFEEIARQLNDKVLYRDNPETEPNEMRNDLDMGLNDILNIKSLYINGVDLAEAVRQPTAPDSEWGDGINQPITAIRFKQMDGEWGEWEDLRGHIGLTGTQGDQGIQGIQGNTGAAGADSTVAGPQGIQGIQGEAGVDGTNGTNGTDGIDGTDGAQGIQGEAGEATLLNNPEFTYTAGLLTEIEYGGGETKDFSYVNGVLSTIDFDDLSTITTKTLNYTDGVLTSITEN